MKGNSNSKKTTDVKDEKKMTNADLMQFLGKYNSIREDKMISDNAKKVLSCLLYVGSKQNESFTIGQRTISELTGVPKNKISANISILVDKGFINCNVGERGKNSEYTINYETMKSYVSLSVPSVPKCPKKVSQSVPSVPNNEGTVKRTVEGTPKDAEIQRVMEKIEVYQKCINEELGTLKKIVLGDININNNINNNINLKDIISNNNNTEEYNIKDHNKKKNITKDNLEILKENTKVKSSNDENLNESRIETKDNISDNEIPSDLPPLDIDSFVSMDNEISNNDNISDSDSSKNELEFSIFGNDIISEDENDKTTVKFIDGKFTVVSETEDEINSSSDVEQDNKILNDSNSSDMTMNNSSDTISNNENLSNNDNFEIWGKLQPIYGKTSNKLVEYLFSEYQTIHSQKEKQGTFAQVKRYISLDKEQLNNVSVPSTGTFGILSLKNETYNFIQCNTDPNGKNDNFKRSLNVEKKTSNDADTAVKMSQLDNYTTDDKKVAPVQPQTANKTYTNPDPNNPKVWEYIKLHLTMKQGSHLMRDVLDEYKEIEAKNIHSIIAYMEDMCKAVRSALEKGLINEMQFNDFKRVFQTLSKGKYNYWRKVFSTRSPKSLMSSEMKMWGILGKPKVVNVDDETSKVDNNTTTTEKVAPVQPQTANTASDNTVVFPDLNELYKMEYNEAIKTLEKFVVDNPNISMEQKLYFNQNISSAFAVQLYDID